jgi:hypothetical protein
MIAKPERSPLAPMKLKSGCKLKNYENKIKQEQQLFALSYSIHKMYAALVFKG